MSEPPKSGIKTTEFWIALASVIVGALVHLGVVPLSESKHLTSALATAGMSAFLVGQYITGRNQLKATPEPNTDQHLDRMIGLFEDLVIPAGRHSRDDEKKRREELLKMFKPDDDKDDAS